MIPAAIIKILSLSRSYVNWHDKVGVKLPNTVQQRYYILFLLNFSIKI